MAHFYLFSSAQKLRRLSRFLTRGSKRLLMSTGTLTALSTQQRSNVDLYNVLGEAIGETKRSAVPHAYDPDFYLRDSEGGFIVFLVENTLFKVHRCLMLREPSAFVDMLTLPSMYPEEGGSDRTPIVLSEGSEKFKDLLWVLYAPPSVFLDSPVRPSIPLKRLLNIVEMTNKYNFESYLSWAIRTLSNMLQDSTGPLLNASPELLARTLHIAALSDHKPLLEILTKHLISLLLWENMHSDAILAVAERHRLAKIIGVIFYKQLLGMVYISPGILAFPPEIERDKRRQLLAAQQSLEKHWDRLRLLPPTFHHDEFCSASETCQETWARLWTDAAMSSTMLRLPSADVLGRLKMVRTSLRKSLSRTTSMSVPCTLAALESISRVRDDVIDGLIDHFVDL